MTAKIAYTPALDWHLVQVLRAAEAHLEDERKRLAKMTTTSVVRTRKRHAVADLSDATVAVRQAIEAGRAAIAASKQEA